MYILWRYDVDWASGVGGDAEQTDRQTEGSVYDYNLL